MQPSPSCLKCHLAASLTVKSLAFRFSMPLTHIALHIQHYIIEKHYMINIKHRKILQSTSQTFLEDLFLLIIIT